MPGAVLLSLAVASLLGLGFLAAAALKGWRSWLELKRLELASGHATPALPRAEMLELRERVRRLEAIADGEV